MRLSVVMFHHTPTPLLKIDRCSLCSQHEQLFGLQTKSDAVTPFKFGSNLPKVLVELVAVQGLCLDTLI